MRLLCGRYHVRAHAYAHVRARVHMRMHMRMHMRIDMHCVRPQSKTDPRVAKTRADCTFVVEKKEQRKVCLRLPFTIPIIASMQHTPQPTRTSGRLPLSTSLAASSTSLVPSRALSPLCARNLVPCPSCGRPTRCAPFAAVACHDQHAPGDIVPIYACLDGPAKDRFAIPLHGLRDSPSRTVLRIRRRRSAWQATCAHAAPKARCSQLILVTSIITHLQIRMSHLSR